MTELFYFFCIQECRVRHGTATDTAGTVLSVTVGTGMDDTIVTARLARHGGNGGHGGHGAMPHGKRTRHGRHGTARNSAGAHESMPVVQEMQSNMPQLGSSACGTAGTAWPARHREIYVSDTARLARHGGTARWARHGPMGWHGTPGRFYHERLGRARHGTTGHGAFRHMARL